MIKVALPNKGQLFEPTVEILTSCGYKLSKSPKSLSSLDPENNVEFYFLRPGDIPLYVASGVLDAGITGKDFAAEKGQPSVPLLDLNYGYSKLCAAVLADSPHRSLNEIAHLRIEGHTDNVGKPDANRKLSQRRAESVRDFLTKNGVVASRLAAQGFGPDRPADVNTTPVGRENNRRVEFVVVAAPKPEVTP